MKKRSASSPQEKQPAKNVPPMSAKLAAELRALEKLEHIDTSDIPEILTWGKAVVGKYYRPVKKQVSIRLDLDILAYFMGVDKAGYQVRINDALRQFVAAQTSKSAEPIEKRTAGPSKAKAVSRSSSSTPKKRTTEKSAKPRSKRAG